MRSPEKAEVHPSPDDSTLEAERAVITPQGGELLTQGTPLTIPIID